MSNSPWKKDWMPGIVWPDRDRREILLERTDELLRRYRPSPGGKCPTNSKHTIKKWRWLARAHAAKGAVTMTILYTKNLGIPPKEYNDLIAMLS